MPIQGGLPSFLKRALSISRLLILPNWQGKDYQAIAAIAAYQAIQELLYQDIPAIPAIPVWMGKSAIADILAGQAFQVIQAYQVIVVRAYLVIADLAAIAAPA